MFVYNTNIIAQLGKDLPILHRQFQVRGGQLGQRKRLVLKVRGKMRWIQLSNRKKTFALRRLWTKMKKERAEWTNPNWDSLCAYNWFIWCSINAKQFITECLQYQYCEELQKENFCQLCWFSVMHIVQIKLSIQLSNQCNYQINNLLCQMNNLHCQILSQNRTLLFQSIN